ncbi:MAG: hypothetical protein RLZZ471_627 [Actinomycetota bacterium]|jgi:hypothetical protein
MTNPQELQNRARQAAVEFANSQSVGEFVTVIDEGDNVSTFLFESKLKGYVGWNFSVSIFSDGQDTSISEVNLMPGEESLLAPKWVPWSERLADYKALQAELEAQAAAEAAEAAESEESPDDVVEVSAETDDKTDEQETEESVPAVLSDESIDAEQDSDDAGKRPPRFLRRRLGRLKYKKDKS